MTNVRRFLSLSALAAAMASLPASAQTAAPPAAAASDSAPAATPGQGNDIVVTAQRREQNLQDVPLAVSAISNVTLERQEATSTQGLLRLFPNVSGAQITGAGANNYSIRGLSNAETAATFDSPVGTYVDGIYLSRINSNNFALFDVKRIEILRGPQGTLFGRNTTGGAVNIVLQQPTDKLDASIEGSYGSFNAKELRGSIDVPLSDHIRTRIAAYGMDEDGWVKNVTTGGHNNAHDGWGVRGAISIDLSPSTTWDISVDHLHDINELIPETKVGNQFISHSGLGELSGILTGKLGDIPGNRVYNDTTGVTSRFTIDSAIGKISIISGYRHLKTRLNLDYFDNPSPIGGYDSVEYSTHDQFSQEANVAGSAFKGLADYTFGLYYFHEFNNTDFGTLLNIGIPLVPYQRTYVNTTDSFAGYGQIDWHITSKLTLTTGGRMTADTKHLHYIDDGNPLVAPSAQVTDADLRAAGIPLHQNASVFTPRVALTYEPSSDLMFFASATKGFKSGGWNIRAATVNQLANFGPETIWSYEAGMRSQFLDRKLTFNLTGFYDYTNHLQIATAGGQAVTTAPVFPVGNFSDFRSYGLEAEGTLNPIHGLSIFANVGYDWTDYKNPTPAVQAQQADCLAAIAAGAASSNCGNGIVTLAGAIAEPLRAPKFTGTLGFTYVIPVTHQWNLVPSGSYRHVSSFNVNSAQLPSTFWGGYDEIAASLGLENPDRGIRVSVGCENCTNINYLVSVIAGYYYYSPPRRWTVRAGVKF